MEQLDWINYGPNIDRRQRKTRIAIETALLELMSEKPLETISISSLAERADINRKTFYNNFDSIDDVLDSINEKLVSYIFHKLPQKITVNNEIEIYNLLREFTASIEPHKALLRQLRSNLTITGGESTLTAHLKDQILPYIERSLSVYKINASIIPYINSYIIDGIQSLLMAWCEDDTLSANQISLLCYNLTISALKLDNYKDILSNV